MAFKKGQSGNPNGKPKGAKNKINQDLRDKISLFLNGEFATVTNEFKLLDPKDKLKFYTDLLQYGLPKLQATSLEIDFEQMTDEQLDYIIEQLKTSAK
jgi:hypothetical protein